MRSTSRRLSFAVLATVLFGCSARGGGGTITGFLDTGVASGDAAVGTDLGVQTGDDVATPVDRGVPAVDTGTAPVCGDSVCAAGESCTNCARDCGKCPPSCGNGTCGEGESCNNCPTDCGACAPRCGDEQCNGTETCNTCPTDCGACAPICGDGSCNGTETCSSCSTDCGTCAATCGDGSCNGGETCTTCRTDCGACAPVCGDGSCTEGETCATCASDCGACDAGTTTSLTTPCPAVTTGYDGPNVECGWRLAQTYMCSSGTVVTVGCTGPSPVTDAGSCVGRVGTCTGDPMIRVCPGTTPCGATSDIAEITAGGYSSDDACGTCPLARYTCPTSGRITVYERGYYNTQLATCTVGRL